MPPALHASTILGEREYWRRGRMCASLKRRGAVRESGLLNSRIGGRVERRVAQTRKTPKLPSLPFLVNGSERQERTGVRFPQNWSTRVRRGYAPAGVSRVRWRPFIRQAVSAPGFDVGVTRVLNSSRGLQSVSRSMSKSALG